MTRKDRPVANQIKFALLAAFLAVGLSQPLVAFGQSQAQTGAVASDTRGQQQARERPAASSTRLPQQSITHHVIEVDGKKLAFTATVGALSMVDQRGEVQEEIGFVAYSLDGADRNQRPVTVAVNGGPGAASAYLNLLAIGPWRLPLSDKAISPSGPVAPVVNAETWLAFTDLVFIDPPGTGYSRVLGNDEVRRRFYSVEGDIQLLSSAIARWVRENDRLASPKFFAGESYGGFRGPLLAEELQTEQGIGLSGLVLVSPVLDFDWVFQTDYAPWVYASRLPSYAAAALEARGQPFDRQALRATEDYAATQYLSDLIRGLQDKEAVARVSEKVAAITGLDPALVRRMAGRVDMRTFQREFRRDSKEVVSAYDTGVASHDPTPTAGTSRFEDPALTAMSAPLTSAMVDLLGNTLGYKPQDIRYELLNNSVNSAWDWGKGGRAQESLTALRRVMALDPAMQVLVVHGATDLVTPYFSSQILLNQLPELGGGARAQLQVYPGGHMFYSRDSSRKALTRDVRGMFEQALKARAVLSRQQ